MGAVRSINKDIKCLVDISRKHCLKINAKKSAVMVFGNDNNRKLNFR